MSLFRLASCMKRVSEKNVAVTQAEELMHLVQLLNKVGDSSGIMLLGSSLTTCKNTLIFFVFMKYQYILTFFFFTVLITV